jgi:hypothetical protein
MEAQKIPNKNWVAPGFRINRNPTEGQRSCQEFIRRKVEQYLSEEIPKVVSFRPSSLRKKIY